MRKMQMKTLIKVLIQNTHRRNVKYDATADPNWPVITHFRQFCHNMEILTLNLLDPHFPRSQLNDPVCDGTLRLLHWLFAEEVFPQFHLFNHLQTWLPFRWNFWSWPWCPSLACSASTLLHVSWCTSWFFSEPTMFIIVSFCVSMTSYKP